MKARQQNMEKKGIHRASGEQPKRKMLSSVLSIGMKVLVIGSGGREHALVWKLRQSPRVGEIFCLPGNGGICQEATCVSGDPKNLEGLLAAAHQLRPDITIFGPTQAAAQLESSKSFAKEFMQRHNIPTAHYAVCTSEDELRKSLGLFSTPVVVKADGLAAGKGVVITPTREEAATVAAEMLSGKRLGVPAARVVLEEHLQGDELSFLVISDGERVAPLVAAQDHKRVGVGDTGANTGGMGAYSSDSLLDQGMADWLLNHI